MILQWNLGKSSAETDGTAVVEQNREHKKTAATTMSPTFHAKYGSLPFQIVSSDSFDKRIPSI